MCPASCKWNWHQELLKWNVKKEQISIYDSKKSVMRGKRFVIINYDMLEKYMSELKFLQTEHIIIDECHYIKNTETKRYNLLKQLVEPTTKLSLLSGTPLKNRIDDFFAYLNAAAG